MGAKGGTDGVVVSASKPGSGLCPLTYDSARSAQKLRSVMCCGIEYCVRVCHR